MKHTEAYDVFCELQPKFDAQAAEVKRLEEAKRTLKAWMKAEGRTAYRGVTLSETASLRFDQAEAKRLLGPKKAEQCMVDSPRFSLLLPLKLRRQKQDDQPEG